MNKLEVLNRLTKAAKKERYDVVFADTSTAIFERKIFCVHTIIQIGIGAESVTATTIIDHPYKGRTKMLRENFDQRNVKLLIEIIKNPRLHCPEFIKSTYL